VFVVVDQKEDYQIVEVDNLYYKNFVVVDQKNVVVFQFENYKNFHFQKDEAELMSN
jgi:hypothetical protein